MTEPSGEQRRSLYGLEGDAELGLPPQQLPELRNAGGLKFSISIIVFGTLLNALNTISFDGDSRFVHLLANCTGLLTLGLCLYTAYTIWMVRSPRVVTVYRLWFTCLLGNSLCLLLKELSRGASANRFDWGFPTLISLFLALLFLRPDWMKLQR